MARKSIQIIVLAFTISLSSLMNVEAQSTELIEWEKDTGNFIFHSQRKSQSVRTARVEEDESLNKTWNDFAQSFVSIDHLDAKGKVRRSSSKHAKTKIKSIPQGYELNIKFPKTKIEIKTEIFEKQGNIIFQIKDEAIKDPNGELLAIYPFPFMLANSDHNEDDYYLIPEGNGALYRHDKVSSQVKNPYRARYYGPNYASQGTGESMYERKMMPKLSLPVYASNIGNQSILAYIQEGAEYTDLILYPKGLVTSYHWMGPKLIYREQFFRVTNQKGDGYYTSQEKRNHFDFRMVLHIFDEKSDYSEMAQWLQNHLFEGASEKKAPAYINIDLLLNEKKDGFLWPQTIQMTSYEEALNILEELSSFYDGKIHLNLQGFGNKGQALSGIHHIPRFFKKTFLNDMTAFLEKVRKLGVTSSLDLNYTEAYVKTHSMKKEDYSRALSDRNLFFEKNQSYLLHPLSSQRYFLEELMTFKKLPIDSLRLREFTNHLYGSFDRKQPLTRKDSRKLKQKMVQASELPLRVDDFVDYLDIEKIDAIVNTKLGSSNHYLFSEDVPFISMVIRSYIPYYSREINLEGHRKDYLLRLLEYGAYPSYILSHEDESKLINAYQKELYGIAYENIQEKMAEDWAFLMPAYEAIGNEKIMEHRLIKEGLVMTRYETVTLLINFSNKDQAYDEYTVPAKSYLIIGGDKV